MIANKATWKLCLLAVLTPVLGWAGNTVVGAGYVAPVPITVAPGELVTIFVQGVGASFTHPVAASALPLPTMLEGISVSLGQSVSPQGPIAVPLVAVFPVATCISTQLTGCAAVTGITLQIPFEMGVFTVPSLGARNVAQLTVTENGASGATVELLPRVDKIHVIRQRDTLTAPESQATELFAAEAIVTHADGSLVSSVAPGNPGEILLLWAVGLGQTNPVVASGQATPAPAPTAPVVLVFDFTPNAEPSRPTATAEGMVLSPTASTSGPLVPVFSGLTPGAVGLYQVNFAVPVPPPGVARCGGGPGTIFSNLTVSIGRDESFDGAGICVAAGAPAGASSKAQGSLPAARR